MKIFNPSHNVSFELYSFSGLVEESNKNMETQVSGGGGGGGSYQGTGGTAPVSISSRTIVHDTIFLTSPDGKERSFQLKDFHLAARKGHQLTVFWGIKSGDKSGFYFAVKNHNTDQEYYRDDLLQKYFIKGWLQGILMLLSSILLLAGTLGGQGMIVTLLGAAGWFWVWKRWTTAKNEISNLKSEIRTWEYF